MPENASGPKTLVVATPAKRNSFSRTMSMPTFGSDLKSRPFSFAELGKAFRPGYQPDSAFGFESIAEEGLGFLVAETPQRKPRLDESLGATPS